MSIKLIAIDIDGTLLDSNGELSIENKQAIAAAQKAGIQIVLCTGRPVQSTQFFLEELDLLGAYDLVVTNNGGLIQEAQTGKIIHEELLTRTDILDIYQLSQKLEMPINLIDLEYIYEPPHPKGVESIYTGGKARKANRLRFIPLDMTNLASDFKVHQIIISRPAQEIEAIIPQIPDTYHDKYTISKSLATILEFMPLNVDKGSALTILQQHFMLEPSDIMGIGDEANDLSLIQGAGLGVAMENGATTVKKAADYVTKSNDENGVAHAIRKFVL